MKVIADYLALITLIAVLTFAPSAVGGEDEGHVCPHGCVTGKFEMMTLTGIHLCVACDIKKELGIPVDCALYGHRWALKVTKAVDYCGGDKSEFVGKTFVYLPNKSYAELTKVESGKSVVVSGKLFFDIPMIEVEKLDAVN